MLVSTLNRLLRRIICMKPVTAKTAAVASGTKPSQEVMEYQRSWTPTNSWTIEFTVAKPTLELWGPME